MKIMITGGHLAPALAVIEEIKKIHKESKIIFVGRKYALDSEKTISLEYKELERRKIKFIPLQAGRLTRICSLKSLRNFFRIPLGFISGFSIINNERPQIILSFGSYMAVPIVFWGFVFRIPIYTHEQTINPGLANKIIGIFSKKIFIAFSEAKKYFNQKKVIISGNPVRKSIFLTKNIILNFKKDRPVIYITGGSLGSHSINLHIKKIIVSLLNYYIVIHQVGDTKQYHDYEDLEVYREKLPDELKNRYFLRKHFFEDEIGYIYDQADLVVGRSGANTFFELVVLKKPALFIPLPWSSGREQQRHAEIFAKAETGEIFHQIEPSEKLYRLINTMIKNINFYKNNFTYLENIYKQDASKIIVSYIFKNN
jgi:UDP-N-acetylglucosamine--N-acetylmuramyl-(pentapeptide) pyrophosphoryl-undecaprenol N-acetylglucosamine transferase